MAASLIASVHNYPRSAPVNMNAAVQVNDIIIIYASSNGGVHATATVNATQATVTMAEPVGGFIDNSNGTQLTLLTGLVTAVGGTGIPAITISNDSDMGFSALAFRGLASATPHKIGSTSASADPMSVTLAPTLECLLVCGWASEDTSNFVSFGNSQTLYQNDTGHFDAQGYNLSIASGSFNATADVSAASTHMALIAAVWEISGAAAAASTGFERWMYG